MKNEDQQLADQHLIHALYDDMDYPDVEPPAGLQKKLYAIGDSASRQQSRWTIGFAAAATFVIAAVLIQFGNTPLKSLSDAEQARHDLLVALSYLNKTNNYVEQNVISTLRENMQRATVVPVFDSAGGTQLERKS